jgi:hypothetical protein
MLLKWSITAKVQNNIFYSVELFKMINKLPFNHTIMIMNIDIILHFI